MRIALAFILLLVFSGCSMAPLYIEPSADLIPDDAAISYLRSEEVSGRYALRSPCYFTEAGVYDYFGHTPFEEVEFVVWRNVTDPPDYHMVYIRKKEGRPKLWGCFAFYAEADQQILNKISTALTSLGIQQVGDSSRK